MSGRDEELMQMPELFTKTLELISGLKGSSNGNVMTVDIMRDELLKKYCERLGLSSEYERLMNCRKQLINKDISITNTGVVSSGKSSLFNVLLGKYDDGQQRFQIGAARTTLASDSEELVQGVRLIDTPGINAKEQDDEEALRTLKSASIVMMIHNIRNGEIIRSEAEWLRQISGWYPDKAELRARFVFVISWIDDKDDTAEYEYVVNNLKRELFEILETEVDVIPVSAEFYIQGRGINDSELIQRSGIDSLREYIVRKSIEYRTAFCGEKLSSEYASVRRTISDVLKEYAAEKERELASIKESIDSEYTQKKEDWSKKYRKFRNYHYN